jgi:putative SOS response-associated peptidase YedK
MSAAPPDEAERLSTLSWDTLQGNHADKIVMRWGLIPYWCEDPKGGRKPINAKCETVRMLPSFREAYRKRRCILPVDGFFEWKAIKGQKAKQPYAIAPASASSPIRALISRVSSS